MTNAGKISFCFALLGFVILANVDWRIAVGLFFWTWGQNIDLLSRLR